MAKRKKANGTITSGLALIVNRKKNWSNTGIDGDVIAIYPRKAPLSGFEITQFDICPISDDCLSAGQLLLLQNGRHVVYPFRTNGNPISCVRVKPAAIKGWANQNR